MIDINIVLLYWGNIIIAGFVHKLKIQIVGRDPCDPAGLIGRSQRLLPYSGFSPHADKPTPGYYETAGSFPAVGGESWRKGPCGTGASGARPDGTLHKIRAFIPIYPKQAIKLA